MEIGFLLIDKPTGMTSHDVVDALRRVTGIRKIGHAGTLDPFGTGLMILAVQRAATKRISEFMKLDKSYAATFVLGATTDSLDPEQEVRFSGKPDVNREQVEQAMLKLTGKIEQIPPMYSAIKKDGKRLYSLARTGQEVEIDPRNVMVHSFTLVGDPMELDETVEIQVQAHVGSGTYIRSLSRDLAETIGTTGYTKQLRRLTIGEYSIENAKPLDWFTAENWKTRLFDPAGPSA